jgi:site-specific DNA-cytosine methylase
MRVLVACEFSGRVRDAFRARGHDAYSVDLLPTEIPGRHVQADVRGLLSDVWDLLIAFPPCTYLSKAGARWWPGNEPGQEQALELVRLLMNAPIPRIAVENPVGAISTQICKPSQIVHPYWFGDAYAKKTCLWLKYLPPLRSTGVRPVIDNEYIVYMPGGRDRARNRSRTPKGLALAMAQQWG